MTLRFRLPFLALALGTTCAHAQSPQDFQLPPQPTPTASPDVQGPVDSDGTVPIRPRAIPTAAPTPAATPEQSAPIPQTLPNPDSGTNRPPAPVEQAPPSREQPRPVSGPPVRAESSEPETDLVPLPSAPDPIGNRGADSASSPSSVSISQPPISTEPEPDEGFGWFGILAALALAVFGGVFAVVKSRGRKAVPAIERPKVGQTNVAAAEGAITVRVEALKLSRSVMNATLFYRVTVLNRSTSPLSNVSVEADLTSAGGNTPMEQQVAGPSTALEPRHERARLAAGQSARFEGQIVLPLAQAKLLRQGKVAMFVPLLRLRATAHGVDPVAKTFAIGPAASAGGDRLVPFRLDEGPRSYEPLAQKAIA